jgi:hypothetical protein
MIPRAHVTHWRLRAPWPSDAQVEQDLVLSRALVELFSDPHIAEALAFRGGTALHKLCFESPGRYSEDIDLVQLQAGAIGSTLDAIRSRLDPWLGDARTKQGEGRATLVYRFETTTAPVQPMRVKVEINTREHFAELGLRRVPFGVDSPWFTGSAEISTFALEELLGTEAACSVPTQERARPLRPRSGPRDVVHRRRPSRRLLRALHAAPQPHRSPRRVRIESE